MKRIGTTSLSIGASLGLLAVAIGCSSGGADPNTGGNAGSSTGNTGNTASGGSGNAPSGGTGNAPSGGTGGTGNAPSGGSAGTGNAPSGGSTGASVCDDITRDLSLEPYVDNFETDLRFGGWYGFADNGMTDVENGPTRVADAALATTMGLHAAATNITTPTSTPEAGFGAGVGFNLVNTALGEDCVDVGAFDGISFWAKGTSGTANSVIFQVVHPGTQPATSLPAGDCTVPAQCFLHPKVTLTLTPDWTHYTVTWAELTGSTFEVTGPILGFNIITPDTAYEMWIDEVTFYSGTAPETPVGPPDDGAGGAGSGAEGGAGGA